MSNLFRGRTLTEANEKARAALGDEIVMCDTRRVKREGLAGLLGGVEYEVEVELDVAPPLPPPSDIEPKWTAPKPFARGVYDDDDDDLRSPHADVSSSNSEIIGLRREVRQMRALLRRLSKNTTPWKQELMMLRRAFDESRPVASGPARVKRLLAQSGIDGRLARTIIRAMRKVADDDVDLIDAYRDVLADRVRVGPWPLASDERKVIAVVGPPGVGKTTTAAKIAARAIGEHGKSVTIIAADTYRVAAIDQIGRYASLLGARLEVAENADELHAIVRAVDSDVIVVDTAGRLAEDEHCVEAGLGLGRHDDDESRTGWDHLSRHVLLCLPAALRAADADQIVQRYGLSSPTSICITKIDLTTAPAGLVLGTAYANLPVTTLCMGQQVPEDIAPATAGAILDYLAPRHSNGTS